MTEDSIPDEDVMDAINVVISHLQTEYIVEECRENRVVGCASCEAIALQEALIAFRNELEDMRTLPDEVGESITPEDRE